MRTDGLAELAGVTPKGRVGRRFLRQVQSAHRMNPGMDGVSIVVSSTLPLFERGRARLRADLGEDPETVARALAMALVVQTIEQDVD